MIFRKITDKILQSGKSSPVICITGPRQSGKTTLIKSIFPEYRYYNLELPQHRQFAEKDALGLLSEIQEGIIIDEIQRVPELLSTIQYLVDETKLIGKIVISGSQNILLMQSVSQTLAGRVALFTLLPFSVEELKNTEYELADYEDYLVKSFFPRIYDQNPNPADWLQDYITTYIERDVRQIMTVQDLSLFTNFLQVCAGHTGQIINYSSLSNSLGVNIRTVKSWLSILETSYIIFIQPPYFKNFNKRVVKSPKLYFYDPGLICSLLGIKNKDELRTHYLKGGIFESFIISEMKKYLYNNKLGTNLYFYRDSNQNELDVIFEYSNMLKAIEIKSGKTITSEFFKSFKNWDKLQHQIKTEKYLIYGGDESQNRTQAKVLSWNKLTEIFNEQ